MCVNGGEMLKNTHFLSSESQAGVGSLWHGELLAWTWESDSPGSDTDFHCDLGPLSYCKY